MSSPFGIVGFLFLKNFPLLIGVVALDYLGMYFFDLGDFVENIMFFLMVFLGLICANYVHSGTDLLKVLLGIFVFDMLVRWGFFLILPKEITMITIEDLMKNL